MIKLNRDSPVNAVQSAFRAGIAEFAIDVGKRSSGGSLLQSDAFT
jgi:hypothetical protein